MIRAATYPNMDKATQKEIMTEVSDALRDPIESKAGQWDAKAKKDREETLAGNRAGLQAQFRMMGFMK